jgi:AmmeMemoRadiSam system protein B
MRIPVAQGRFYPFSAEEITELLNQFNIKIIPKKCYGVVSPHAGYAYSGETALLAISSIDFSEIETVIIIGISHMQLGRGAAVSYQDWQTPLGIMENDKELAQEIAMSGMVSHDESAHDNEHSVEVQLPVLQYVLKKNAIKKNIRIVPIVMTEQGLGACQKLAQSIFNAIKKTRRKTVIIASSDFSHHIAADVAEKYDKNAIEFLVKADIKGFHAHVENYNLSICGYGPVTVLGLYSQMSGFGFKVKGAELLRYTHSGVVTADYAHVVGYAAIRF